MQYLLNKWKIMKIFSFYNGIKITEKEEQSIVIFEYDNNTNQDVLFWSYKWCLQLFCLFCGLKKYLSSCIKRNIISGSIAKYWHHVLDIWCAMLVIYLAYDALCWWYIWNHEPTRSILLPKQKENVGAHKKISCKKNQNHKKNQNAPVPHENHWTLSLFESQRERSDL